MSNMLQNESNLTRVISFQQRLAKRLEQNTWLAAGLRRTRGWLYGEGWGAFHCDLIYRRLMLDLLDAFHFTAFVETGTCRGYSTEFIASHHRQLPVFTSEVVQSSYELSKDALSKYLNVTPHLGNSSDWIGDMLSKRKFGDFPLFFLDAHWQRYWPLRDELRHIANAKLRTVIVIDDFEVPGHPQFGYDIDGGSDVVEGEKCNLDYIRPSFLSTNTYHAIFPKYSRQDAKISSRHGAVRGHVILFQNASAEYETCRHRPLIQEYYNPVGQLVPTATK
ncbi:MAG TPA: hypothetical protein VGM58_09420 [Verrucomicrobiae bacterium]|jgi:hypothetical protein